MIRSAWVWLNALLFTALFGGWVVILSWVRPERTGPVGGRMGRRWGARILRSAGVMVRVEGADVLETGEPQILVCNHESWFDVFALLKVLPPSGRFVAKKELAGIPVFGRAVKAAGHVFIDRGDRSSAIESLEEAGRHIRGSSHKVVMFAEGTRSATGKLGPFKKGAFVLALQAGVPIVPLAVLGGRQILPKGSFRVRSGEMVVKVGEPISVEGRTHHHRDELRQEAWRRVAELKGCSDPPGMELDSDPAGR